MQVDKLTQAVKDDRVVVRLPIEQKLRYIKAMEELDMTPSQFFIYLMENYFGNNLTVLRNFRYNLDKRVKKGINQAYLDELTKIKNYIEHLEQKIL